MACPESTFVLGVGGFGETFADSRHRFGEFLAVCGAAAYQPADGTDVPDYLVASGALALEPRLLYGLACDGTAAHLVRFERSKEDGPILLSDLAAGCLDVAKSPAAGMVIMAETAGLIGAALRRSPATENLATDDLFEHPGVRERLTFTAEPAFPRSTVLLVGVVQRGASIPALESELRPIGTGEISSAIFTPLRSRSVRFRRAASSSRKSCRISFGRKNCSACFTCCGTIAARSRGGRASSFAAHAGSGRLPRPHSHSCCFS